MRKFDNNSALAGAERFKVTAQPRWVFRRKCYSTVDSTVVGSVLDPVVTTKHRAPESPAWKAPWQTASGFAPSTPQAQISNFLTTAKKYDALVSTLPRPGGMMPAEARIYSKPAPPQPVNMKHIGRGFRYDAPPAASTPPLPLASPKRAPPDLPVVVQRPPPLYKSPRKEPASSALRAPSPTVMDSPSKNVSFAETPRGLKGARATALSPVNPSMGMREELGRPSAVAALPGVGAAVMQSRADAWGGGSTWSRGSTGFGQTGLF